MLQIIIWMGCVYFIVRGLEIASRPGLKPAGIAAAVVAFIAAPVFYFVAEAQVASSALGSFSSSAYQGVSADDLYYGNTDAEAVAENALANADAAIRNAEEALADAAR